MGFGSIGSFLGLVFLGVWGWFRSLGGGSELAPLPLFFCCYGLVEWVFDMHDFYLFFVPLRGKEVSHAAACDKGRRPWTPQPLKRLAKLLQLLQLFSQLFQRAFPLTFLRLTDLKRQLRHPCIINLRLESLGIHYLKQLMILS